MGRVIATGCLVIGLGIASQGWANERVSLFQWLGAPKSNVTPASYSAPAPSAPATEALKPSAGPAPAKTGTVIQPLAMPNSAPAKPAVSSGFVTVPEKLPAKMNARPVVEDVSAAPTSIPTATSTPAPASAPSADAKTRRVKSRHLVFNYRVKEVGSSGVGGVEAWITRDGQTWQKARAGMQPQGAYHMDVDDDGLYGVTLVARTGLGGGKAPPKAGDAPQFWVDVDTTKPTIVLTSVKFSSGGRVANISWKASDKNLGGKPINLFYTDISTGQTQVIATQIENAGAYNWQIPARTPTSVRIRVQATDQAGNVAADESAHPLQLDLSQPEVVDVDIATRE